MLNKKRGKINTRYIVKWLDKEIKTLRFASRSHAIEYALLKLMEQEEKWREHNEKEKIEDSSWTGY